MRHTPPTTVLYHADCLDGFGAAFAAWKKLSHEARFLPLHHGELWEQSSIRGHRVFILDFSFPPEALLELANLAHELTLIDHHATAHAPWTDRLRVGENGLETWGDGERRLSLIFHLQKSGARLAWEYFHPDTPLPKLLQHIEDQDLWRFTLPDTPAFCRALRLQAFDFSRWDALLTDTADTSLPTYREMILRGEAIEIFLKCEVDRMQNSHLLMPAQLRGEPLDALQAQRHGQDYIEQDAQQWLAIHGLAINANTLFASELGHQLASRSGSFGLIWQLTATGEIKASLRSNGDFDVATIAQRYGGGGHRNAAGFRLPQTQFMHEVLGLS